MPDNHRNPLRGDVELVSGDAAGQEKLNRYLEGWRLGDGTISLEATAPEFHYDDPNTGRIQRDQFVGFVEDFKQAVVDMTGEPVATPFLTYSDTVVSHQDGLCWCWWQATGSDFQGAAVIRFGPSGVVSEKIGYFSRLP